MTVPRCAIACALIVVFVLGACTRRAPNVEGPVMVPTPPRSLGATATDPSEYYRRTGFLVADGDVSFVGSARFIAGPSDDSTYAVIALSLANRGLTFTREGERYRAAYDVTLQLRRSGVVLQTITSHEEVRVSNVRETTRNDESIIYQHVLLVPPGPLDLDITINDAGSPRRGRAQSSLAVPRFTNEGLGWPIVAYTVTPRSSRAGRPELVTNPRATATFGRDSVVEIYVEAYGRTTNFTLRLEVQNAEGQEVVVDTMPLVDRGGLLTAEARLPISRLGFGLLQVLVSRFDGGAPVRVPLIVGFGDGLIAGSFEEMLQYLRYFTSADRLQRLRDAAPDARSMAWSMFLRETDTSPTTPENEELREYFGRLETANARYREGVAAGWSTDRGMVFSALGEPDNVIVPNDDAGSGRLRSQVWEYTRHRTRLTFTDQTGTDQWRLTPSSQGEFEALVRRLKP
jgi:GWxTD domain-containing protein